MDQVTRRGFIAIGAAGVAGSAPLSFFDAKEAELVTLIAEQIIPADHDPGATDAGVVNYIDRQLTGPLKPFAKLYREALPLFEPMRTLDKAGQQGFLMAVEKRGDAASRLFAAMIDHTMQGFYGPPSEGGNRDEVSWKMLGVAHELGGHH